MFDPNERLIGVKPFDWDLIRRGQIMNLTFDLETGGGVRRASERPYVTPGYPVIEEYGDCLTDFAGNYLNSAQIFPRCPEELLPEPAAAILQRLKNGAFDYYDPDRPEYWIAMASMAWRIERAMFDYPKFNDEKRYVLFRDINKQFKHGEKDGAEEVIEIPLRDGLEPDSPLVYDARYHPQRRKVAYRFEDRDGRSPYYENNDNLYYIDEEDGSKWKWVDARLGIDGFNNKRFDLPIVRTNLRRIGFSPRDTTFMYSRGKPSNVQRPKNFMTDVRDLIYMTALYGPQGEDGIKLARLIDPRTGKIRTTEALAEFLEANTGFGGAMRFTRGGIFMPDNGSRHDRAMDHGAAYDALGTAAARNLCRARAPEICKIFNEQADHKKLYQVLTANSPQGDKLPVWSLPRREGGYSHSESPYWFLGTDDQIGRFKRMMFLHTNGNFHKTTHNGKHLHELEIGELVEMITSDKFRNDPDKAIRIENVNKFPGAMYIEDIYQKTSQAQRYRQNLPDILKDCNYIFKHSDMREKIMSAQEEIHRRLRFESHDPHFKYMEDELSSQYSGEIHFQEEGIELERRRLYQEYGPQKPLGILETTRNAMNNVYKTHMIEIDALMGDLIFKGHMIDAFRNLDSESKPHLENADAREIFDNWKDLAERSYKKLKDKKWNYRKILDEMVNPYTGEAYFQKGKFIAASPREAFEFRRLLGIRAMEDFKAQLLKKDNEFIKGKVDRDFCAKPKGKDSIYLLFADPDSGEKGAAPYIVDKAGREVDIGFIKKQPISDVLNMLEDRHFITLLQVEKNLWRAARNEEEIKATPLRKRRKIEKRDIKKFLRDNPDMTGLIDQAGAVYLYKTREALQKPIFEISNKSFDVLPGPQILRLLHKKSWAERVAAPWRYKFYRLRSEQSMGILLKRFVNLGLRHHIPAGLEELYEADLHNRLHGLPSGTATTDRTPTLRSCLRDVESLELSSTMRDPLLLQRDSNPAMGAAAIMVQTDEGQRGLALYRAWLEGKIRDNPPNKKLVQIGGHDPQSGMPYDDIEYLIKRRADKPLTADPGIVVIDVPAWHTRFPIEQTDICNLPQKMLVVPNLPEQTRSKIRRGMPVIIREIETGVLYHCGPASLNGLLNAMTQAAAF